MQMGWGKLFDESENLVGLIGCHADDLICCGEGSQYEDMLKQLQEAFPFGSWRDAQSETIMFCGREMRQGAHGTIYVNQERYALGVTEIPISNQRRQEKDASLTPEERSQFRAVPGALSWRGTQTAPWLCASVSCLQGPFATVTVKDLW